MRDESELRSWDLSGVLARHLRRGQRVLLACDDQRWTGYLRQQIARIHPNGHATRSSRDALGCGAVDQLAHARLYFGMMLARIVGDQARKLEVCDGRRSLALGNLSHAFAIGARLR